MKHFVDLFPEILRMSAIASIAILFVIATRFLLRKAPKIFSYILWAVVLFRLLVPVTITSPVSAMPEILPADDSLLNYVLPDFVLESPINAVPDIQQPEQETPNVPAPTTDERTVAPVVYLTVIWLAGAFGMLLYSIISYGLLRRKLRLVMPLRNNVYIADDIQSPFVIGFFRPKIYLPCNIGAKEQEYIILHEQYHIKRLDHIVKLLAFLVLSIHWFNPLVWVAFVLASKDMEMSCDEAVIRTLGEAVRADYSASLLTLATGRRMITGTPLAFGEGDPKGRIRNLAAWKKPALWVILAAAAVCAVLAVCLLTDPAPTEDVPDTSEAPTEQTDGTEAPATQTTSAPAETTAPEEPGQITLENIPDVFELSDAVSSGFVIVNSDDHVYYNQTLWVEFLSAVEQGTPATVRYAHQAERATYYYEIVFNGDAFTRRCKADGAVVEQSFAYLLRFEEKIDPEKLGYNESGLRGNEGCIRYVLSNQSFSSWTQAKEYAKESDDPENTTAVTVFGKNVNYPFHPEIPTELTRAELKREGTVIVAVTDPAVLKQIQWLIGSAENVGFTPKTYSDLCSLTLTGTDGTAVTVGLDVEFAHDLCIVNGEFYDYGPGYTAKYDNVDASGVLLSLFGLEQWPIHGEEAEDTTVLNEGRALTAAELERYNQLFQGNSSRINWYNMLLWTKFDSPQNINLSTLFMNGVDGFSKLTEEEKAYLTGIGFDFANVGICRIPVTEADRILQQYLGLIWEQTSGYGEEILYYYPAENCFYCEREDFLFSLDAFEFIAGNALEDGTIKLYYTQYGGEEVYVITMHGSIEEGFVFLSNVRAGSQ